MRLVPKNDRVVWVLIILLDVVMLSPLLEAGHNGDDAINSTLNGVLAESDDTPAGLAQDLVRRWAADVGRFYPLAFHYVFFYSYVRSRLVCNLVGLALVLVNVLLFARFVTRLTGSSRYGMLAALVVPLLFQFRYYHDPILGFRFLMQVLFLFLIGSLLCLDHYLQNRKLGALGLSLLFYILGALTYEVMYVAFVVHALLVYYRTTGPRRVLVASVRALPFALTAVAFVLLAVGLRKYFGVPVHASAAAPSTPYRMNLDPVLYLTTLAKQTVAALPLSYFLLGRYFQIVRAHISGLDWAGVVMLAFGCTALFYLLLSGSRPRRGEQAVEVHAGLRPFHLAGLGSLMAIFPGLLVALSPRYQSELTWGLGHLPVYVAAFGVGLVVVAGFRGLAELYPRSKRFFRLSVGSLAVVLGLVASVNYVSNSTVVAQLGHDYRHSREVLEEGLRHGLGSELPAGADVFVSSNRSWETPLPLARPGTPITLAGAFFRQHTGKHLHVRNRGTYLSEEAALDRLGAVERLGPDLIAITATNGTAYYLAAEARSREEGFVILGRVDRLVASPAELRGAAGKSALIYVRLPFRWHDFQVRGGWIEEGSLEPASAFVLDRYRLRLLRCGQSWLLCELTADEGRLLDLLSLRVTFGPATAGPSVLGPAGSTNGR